jgi:GMP synthase-like glutamine amidotransferase
MQVLCLTHVEFEGPARIAEWVDARRHRLTVVRADVADKLPDPAVTDLLLLMGGPMSANDSYTWLKREVAFVEQVLRKSRPVLGVCLGAQLLAKIFGARVYPAGQKEIGWWPVRRVQPDKNSTLPLPDQFSPLHWHGETFDLPAGALRLAESEAAENQAFSINGNVIGLQFHIEATPDSVASLVDGAKPDIDGGRWQQPAEEIYAQRFEHCARLEKACFRLLDCLTVQKLTT